MHAKDLFFVIPTYRLREVGETVQAYDEHFRRNGHTVLRSRHFANIRTGPRKKSPSDSLHRLYTGDG
jgi:hypothetical protein